MYRCPPNDPQRPPGTTRAPRRGHPTTSQSPIEGTPHNQGPLPELGLAECAERSINIFIYLISIYNIYNIYYIYKASQKISGPTRNGFQAFHFKRLRGTGQAMATSAVRVVKPKELCSMFL